NEEDDLGNLDGGARDPSKAQNAGNQCNDQERDYPVQHDLVSIFIFGALCALTEKTIRHGNNGSSRPCSRKFGKMSGSWGTKCRTRARSSARTPKNRYQARRTIYS